MGAQLGCGLGRDEPLRRAREERYAERLLERRDMPADGRLCQIELARRARQRSLTQHCEEGAIELPARIYGSHAIMYNGYLDFRNFV